MQDLQEVTHDLHYENYRASRLGDEPEAPVQQPVKGSKKAGGEAEKDRILQEKELELQKMQQMIAAMQAQLQAQQETTKPSKTTKSSSRSSNKV